LFLASPTFITAFKSKLEFGPIVKVSCSNVIFAPLIFSGWISGTICLPSGDFSSLYVSSSLSLSVRASVVIADAETLKVKGLFDVL